MLKFQQVKQFALALATGALVCAAGPLRADETLTIGSDAPALDIEHWVSTAHETFEPVDSFKKGNVYVVEFWATWCGPCIASMPHLAELQEEYAPKGVQVISISDEDMETVEKFLEREVRGYEEGDEGPATYGELTSAYCLTTDPDESCHEAYMRAAAQNGIPTAFIVGKTGQVEWIGHPMSMDEPLEQIVADEWDRDSFAEEFKKEQELDKVMMEISMLARKGEFSEAMELIEEAEEKFEGGRMAAMLGAYRQRITSMQLAEMVQEGNTDEAMVILDGMIESAEGMQVTQLKMQKLNMLITAEKQEDAASLLLEMKDAPPSLINQATWTIYQQAAADKGNISEALLEAAVEVTEVAAEADPNAPILDTLAHLVYVQGDVERALEIQQKAVEAGDSPDPEISAFLKALKKELAGDDEEEDDKEGDEDK